ncbi:MAG: hypothetical protein AB1393_08760 [Candidatus Edwardsbacteria bacterium]
MPILGSEASAFPETSSGQVYHTKRLRAYLRLETFQAQRRCLDCGSYKGGTDLGRKNLTFGAGVREMSKRRIK